MLFPLTSFHGATTGLILLCLLASSLPKAAAHPVVPAFDRILVTEVANDPQGGLLLLAELNCTACHAAPKELQERLAAKPAPNLAGVGSKLDASALERFIRNPQHRKQGTLMPGLFAEQASDEAPLKALAAYLSSLKESLPPMPNGDAERGRKLFHNIGCIACHEPDADTHPSAIPAEQKALKPKLASVPIALATDYEPQALADFLFDPLRHRPSGKMPSLHLTKEEAADLAQYLKTSAKAVPPTSAPVSKDTQAGRAQFIQQRCTACHSVGEELPKPAAKPLADLNAEHGCLAASKTSGIPHYDLSDAQSKAIQLALQTLKAGASMAQTVQQKIDWQLSRMNCYACHQRDAKGGLEEARAQYYGVNDPGAESLGELAHLPPKLDRVGRKLTREWFAKILLEGGGSVRPYMNARMPDFGKASTEPLIPWLEEADQLAEPVKMDVSGLLGHQRAETGRKLLGATGLACVSCHGFKDRKSLGPPVIRLTQTVARLRPGYFKELLLNPQVTQPGTLMPPLFMGRKAAEKEVESIWTYLKEVDSQPLPEGLFSNADFELKPSAGGRPIILRSFIEGAGTHAIGIGFPQGLNASFDAKSCQWATIWKGRYLDALSNWQDRTMKPISPLGTDVKTLSGESTAREFRGYRLLKNGTPVMLYDEGGVEVEDRLEPDAAGQSFIRVIKRGTEKETQEVLSW